MEGLLSTGPTPSSFNAALHGMKPKALLGLLLFKGLIAILWPLVLSYSYLRCSKSTPRAGLLIAFARYSLSISVEQYIMMSCNTDLD